MNVILKVLPFVSAAVSVVFAAFVLRRLVTRGGLHHLLWALGLLFYAVGGLCEGLYGVRGWNPLVFRLWYLFGAMLVAAWLGQGTVYLWFKGWWTHVLMGLLVAASLYGAMRVFNAQLHNFLLVGPMLSGRALVTPGVRSLTPIFNAYGTLALVGGAAWSAIQLARKRVLPHRVVGNILIAVGAILPALGGAFSRFGVGETLYASELAGVVLMFIGFLRAVAPFDTNPAGASPESTRS
jgi:hypothetical protein